MCHCLVCVLDFPRMCECIFVTLFVPFHIIVSYLYLYLAAELRGHARAPGYIKIF